jgi:hypothetical protein
VGAVFASAFQVLGPHSALMGSRVRPADTASTGTVYSANCPLFLRSAGLSRPRT